MIMMMMVTARRPCCISTVDKVVDTAQGQVQIVFIELPPAHGIGF